MTVEFLTAISVAIVLWSLVSGRAARWDISGPVVFVVAGLVLCNGPVSLLDIAVETESVHALAEITLALLLFADASQVDPRHLAGDAALPARLLAIGLPLTLAAGFALAATLLELPWELAALLGAVLAPTDAALSAAVVTDRAVPSRIRRSLNVESGLNDGLATPVVTTLLAASAVLLGGGAVEGASGAPGAEAVADLVGGVLVGLVVGYGGGRLIAAARERSWMEPGGRRIAVLGLAVAAFSAADGIGVNYFVAAFVAGVAFRLATGALDEEAIALPELLGRVLALAVWFVFGAALLVPGLEALDWRILLYAVLSLTVVRMVPVALSLVGVGASRSETLFIGWFGPRGLASVVFGLLIVEELPGSDPLVDTVVATIVVTVLLSVVAHGASARPLTARLAGSQH